MSVLIEVGRQKAILRHGEWRSADLRLERLLNSHTKLWIQRTGGPSPGEHDHEQAIASEIARQFGGRILLRVRPRESGGAEVYLRYRQLELEFR